MTTIPAQIYSAEQIKIPAELPEILKNYCKHIIRSKPDDIYKSSLEYFQKLSTLQKNRTARGVSVLQLSTFFNKFTMDKLIVSRQEIKDACEWSDISSLQFEDTLSLGRWEGDQIPWTQFFAFLCASAAGNLKDTILTAAKAGSVNGETNLQFMRMVFEVIVSTDGDLPTFVQDAVKMSISSVQGVQMPVDSLIVALESAFKTEEPQEGGATEMHEDVPEVEVKVDEEQPTDE